MSARLWLVRHGSTEWTNDHRLNGWTDVGLNSDGCREALALRGRLPEQHVDGIWSSDLSRAIETARLAAGEPSVDRRLREVDFGTLDGARWEECPPEVQRSLLAFDGFRAPGGESVRELRDRVLSFVGELATGRHLLFTHGGVIRILLREIGLDRHVPPAYAIALTWPDDGEAPQGTRCRTLA